MNPDVAPNLHQDDTAGPFLKHHRVNNGIRLRELGRRVGYSHGYLSQIEGGKVVPFETVLLIANAIGELAAEKQQATA